MNKLSSKAAAEIAGRHNDWVGCQSGSAIPVWMETGKVGPDLLTGGSYLNAEAAQGWALLRIGWQPITPEGVQQWHADWCYRQNPKADQDLWW